MLILNIYAQQLRKQQGPLDKDTFSRTECSCYLEREEKASCTAVRIQQGRRPGKLRKFGRVQGRLIQFWEVRAHGPGLS